MRSLQTIIEELNGFPVNQNEDGDNEERLYELLKGLVAIPGSTVVVPAMFALLERYPTADFGSPGPIVHTIEALGGYEDDLRESLKCQPTYLTVWMVNRILNTELPEAERLAWLTDLRNASANPAAPERAKEEAVNFLRYQEGA